MKLEFEPLEIEEAHKMFDAYLLVLFYIIGMFFIGYPMAKKSLSVWKHSGSKPLIEALLFPLTSFDRNQRIGVLNSDGIDTGLWFLDSDIHCALQEGDAEPIARYLLLTMISWPLRFAWSLFVGTFLLALSFVMVMPVRMLSRCQRCVTID